jgi:Arc/MetJ family transcription regulator
MFIAYVRNRAHPRTVDAAVVQEAILHLTLKGAELLWHAAERARVRSAATLSAPAIHNAVLQRRQPPLLLSLSGWLIQ